MTAVDRNSELVQVFEEFYRQYYEDEVMELAQKYPSEKSSLTINLEDVRRKNPTLADDLREQPEQLLESAEEALRLYDLPVDVDLSNASVRVRGMLDEFVYDIDDLRKDHHGQLLSLDGQVSRRTQVKLWITEAAFECQRCGTITRIPQTDTEGFQEPHECQGCERQGPFSINRDQSDFQNGQKLRLKIPPEKAQGHSNESIDVTVKDDLVNKVDPGDRVRMPVIVGLEQDDDNKPTFSFTGRAKDIQTKESDYESIEYEEHLDRIKQIANDEPTETIIDSIAPSIHGHREEKLAIACSLFGGVEKELAEGTTQRGDSHTLLIGDPGTGKSDLISYAADIAPRSVYTDGKGSTSAGLTASATRNEFGDGEWSIEGGAIVKAHRGIACIDELDDMDEDDRSALHTVLEKQQVPVSKAGINTQLPAKTTLLAAANPEHGRFDIYEPIPDQINLNPALVSRFDLIFTMFDRPEEEKDREVIEHKAEISQAGQRRARGETIPDDQRDRMEPEISKDVLRAYIAYAKDQIYPVYTEEAKGYVQEEFVEIRGQNRDEETDPAQNPVPVTYRKQDAVDRLSEALARMELSETITTDHVDTALRLVKSSLKDVAIDPETGELDADRVEVSSSKSQRERLEFVKEVIATEQESYTDGVPEEVILSAGDSEGYTEQQIEHAIDKLLQRGEIYEPMSDGNYRTT